MSLLTNHTQNPSKFEKNNSSVWEEFRIEVNSFCMYSFCLAEVELSTYFVSTLNSNTTTLSIEVNPVYL